MGFKPVINVKCPCCHHVLEIDVQQEKVISHRKGLHLKDDAKEGEDTMDVALRAQRETRSKVESEFLGAQENLRGQSQRLDDFFKKATEKAKQEKPDPADKDNPFRPGKNWD